MNRRPANGRCFPSINGRIPIPGAPERSASLRCNYQLNNKFSTCGGDKHATSVNFAGLGLGFRRDYFPRFSLSDRHRGFDMGVWIIILEDEVFIFIRENRLYCGIDQHGRQWPGGAAQLQFSLFDMIHI